MKKLKSMLNIILILTLVSISYNGYAVSRKNVKKQSLFAKIVAAPQYLWDHLLKILLGQTDKDNSGKSSSHRKRGSKKKDYYKDYYPDTDDSDSESDYSDNTYSGSNKLKTKQTYKSKHSRSTNKKSTPSSKRNNKLKVIKPTANTVPYSEKVKSLKAAIKKIQEENNAIKNELTALDKAKEEEEKQFFIKLRKQNSTKEEEEKQFFIKLRKQNSKIKKVFTEIGKTNQKLIDVLNAARARVNKIRAGIEQQSSTFINNCKQLQKNNPNNPAMNKKLQEYIKRVQK